MVVVTLNKAVMMMEHTISIDFLARLLATALDFTQEFLSFVNLGFLGLSDLPETADFTGTNASQGRSNLGKQKYNKRDLRKIHRTLHFDRRSHDMVS